MLNLALVRCEAVPDIGNEKEWVCQVLEDELYDKLEFVAAIEKQEGLLQRMKTDKAANNEAPEDAQFSNERAVGLGREIRRCFDVRSGE